MTQIAVVVYYCPVHGPVTKGSVVVNWAPGEHRCNVYDDDRDYWCGRPVSGPHILASMTRPEE